MHKKTRPAKGMKEEESSEENEVDSERMGRGARRRCRQEKSYKESTRDWEVKEEAEENGDEDARGGGASASADASWDDSSAVSATESGTGTGTQWERGGAHDAFCLVCKADATEESPIVSCSQCPNAFHLDCHEPPLRREPRAGSHWFCSDCRGETNLRKMVLRKRRIP